MYIDPRSATLPKALYWVPIVWHLDGGLAAAPRSLACAVGSSKSSLFLSITYCMSHGPEELADHVQVHKALTQELRDRAPNKF
jgi:hypothetical protein